MEFIESIDPFLLQLVIVPLLVIGIGVLASILTKKIYIGPFVTLFLNLLYETWHAKHYYPESDIGFTSWNIVFPIITLLISWLISLRIQSKN